jgi:hypothetical protein
MKPGRMPVKRQKRSAGDKPVLKSGGADRTERPTGAMLAKGPATRRAGTVTGGLIDDEDSPPSRYCLGTLGWPWSVCRGFVAHAGAEPALGHPGGRDAMGIARSDHPLRDHRVLGVRAFAGRVHAADRPAGGHEPAKRRHPARTVGVGRSLARPAAAALPAEPRAGGHDRRRLPAGHSDAPASDRDGDRLVCGQAVGSGRDQRFDCGHKPELCVRLRARRAVAGYAWSSAQWA